MDSENDFIGELSPFIGELSPPTCISLIYIYFLILVFHYSNQMDSDNESSGDPTPTLPVSTSHLEVRQLQDVVSLLTAGFRDSNRELLNGLLRDRLLNLVKSSPGRELSYEDDL